jgi:hypothetical protein
VNGHRSAWALGSWVNFKIVKVAPRETRERRWFLRINVLQAREASLVQAKASVCANCDVPVRVATVDLAVFGRKAEMMLQTRIREGKAQASLVNKISQTPNHKMFLLGTHQGK